MERRGPAVCGAELKSRAVTNLAKSGLRILHHKSRHGPVRNKAWFGRVSCPSIYFTNSPASRFREENRGQEGGTNVWPGAVRNRSRQDPRGDGKDRPTGRGRFEGGGGFL